MVKKAPSIAKFRIHYKVTLGLVLALSIVGQVIIGWFMAQEKGSNIHLEMAYEQRILAQRLTQLSYRATFNQESFVKVKEEFLLSLRTFKKNHASMLEVPLEKSDLSIHYNVMNNDFKALVSVFNCIVDKLCSQEKAKTLILKLIEGKNHSEQYFQNMGQIISTYKKNSEDQLSHLQIAGLVLIALILVSLVFEIMMVFEPTISALGSEFHDRKKAEETSLEASRLAEIGTLSASIGHEVKNITMIIDSSLSFLIKKIEKGDCSQEETLKFAERGLSAARRLSEVTKALTKISRSETKENMKQVSLNEIVSDAKALCRDQASILGVDFRINLDPKHKVFANSVQVSQVLLNLFSNSLHAIKDLDDKWIDVISSINEQGLVEIRVIDSGPGIPDDIAEKLFDNFFTTKVAGEGTGLGMGISRALVEQNKGQLYYETFHGNTSFVIALTPEKGFSVNNMSKAA